MIQSMQAPKYVVCSWGLVGLLLLGVFVPRLSSVSVLLHSLGYIRVVPAFWVGVIIFLVFLLPRVHVPGRLYVREQIIGYAVTGAVIFLAIRFSAGFLLEVVTASPYTLTPLGVLFNWIDFFPALIAREMIRAYFLGVACYSSKRPQFWIVLITIGFALLEVNFNRVVILSSFQGWFIFIAKDVVPVFAKNCLLTILVLYGGAKGSVAYSGSLGAFQYIFPFLPSLPWIAESAFGITFPIVMAIFVRDQYLIFVGRQPVGQQESIGAFSALLVASVAFIWFVVGVFPIYPSVVLTGSMEPEIKPGDVVLIKRFVKEEEIYALAENDVINFKRENITVTHRVIQVLQDENGNFSFQTKGDNNTSPDDEMVLPGNINGRVERVVPKVGILVLLLHSNDTLPEGVI